MSQDKEAIQEKPKSLPTSSESERNHWNSTNWRMADSLFPFCLTRLWRNSGFPFWSCSRKSRIPFSRSPSRKTQRAPFSLKLHCNINKNRMTPVVPGTKIYTYHSKKKAKEQYFKDERNEVAFRLSDFGEEKFFSPAADTPPITIRIVRRTPSTTQEQNETGKRRPQ